MLSRHRAWLSISRTLFAGALPCALACASAPPPPPISAAPPSTSNTPSSPPPETPATPPAAKPAKKREPTTVVVEIGAEKDAAKGSDIVSIARAEKERRRQASPPAIVITNDTLVRRPGPKKGAPSAPLQAEAPAPASGTKPGLESQETLWRSRALDVRMRLKEARDRTEKLRRLTASMRDRFYLAPPQLGRDDSLWQEWGRLQESLAEAQKESEETEKELENLLEEGVAAGAHAGWLAEGEDLFLDPEKEEGSSSVQAIEPPVIPPPGAWR